jgi:TatD DNase family protein
MEPVFIDTHCHIHDEQAFPKPEAAVARAMAAGVSQLVVVGIQPEDWLRALAFSERFPNVWVILGWHPNRTADYTAASLAELRSLLAHPNVVALGEIGLDFHWDYASKEIQLFALNEQLDLAEKLHVPVVFHARNAYAELLDVLEARAPQPYLFHCFAGNAEEAARAVALGAILGVDGPVTYKKADDLRGVLRDVPLDRIVLETDSPYMAPAPHRGKPNEPSYIPYIAQSLSEVFGVTVEEIAARTTQTAKRFFRR